MKRKLFWLMAVVLTIALTACGGGPSGGPGANDNGSAENTSSTDNTADQTNTGTETEAPTEGAGDAQLAPELSVYNWADYIDDQILADYEAEYGVKIIYDTYASNEDLLSKLQAGATGYDVIFPSDYMVSQMIELGLLHEIDTSQLSNWGNIDPDFANAPFDPNNKHCVPYQWGTTGITYRAGTQYFEDNPPDSWAFLFDPEHLQNYSDGGINVLNDQRELLGAALVYLGYDMNSTERSQLEEARDVILQAKPYWKTFNSEDYDNSLLVPDEVVLSQAWSGDAALAYYETYSDETEDGNWYYAIPKEGADKWLDNICITASTQRYETALHFMNYLLDAKVGATITNYTYYASPNEAAKEYINEDILNDPGIFPTPEVRTKLQWLTEVGDAIFIYDEMWTAIKG